MEKFLVDRIDRTVDNYRLAKEYLKNDGDILNHFASLVFSHYEKEIPIDRIKEIRKEIKAATPRMSPFRGDILYIISLLIATTDKEIQQEIIENMFSAMEKLEENGFRPCSHLVLTAYVIGRYGSARKQDEIVYKLKESYILLKEKYNNITNEDDYLLCALWSINNIEMKVVNDFIENNIEKVTGLANEDFERIVYLGSSTSKGIARESALKVLELTAGKVNASYDTPLGFRHGPKSVVDDETVSVIYISNDEYTRKYDLDLAKEMLAHKKNDKVVIVGDNIEEDILNKADYVFNVENINYTVENEVLLPLQQIIFGQMLSFLKSVNLGITPDNPCPTGEVNRVVQGVILHELV